MSVLSRLIALVASLIISFLLAEVALRIRGRLRPLAPERALFWSVPLMVTEERGAVTFAPSAMVREVAVYEGTIEYDMAYKTNDFGAVDTIDYGGVIPPRARSILVVGDSFTAGSGGYAWVPRLRERLPDAMVFDFGVPGTGIEHFEKLISHASRRLKFSEIAILAPGDDFVRRYWHPQVQGDRVIFCIGEGPGCTNGVAIARTIAFDEATADIVARARMPGPAPDSKATAFSGGAPFLFHSKILDLARAVLRGRARTAEPAVAAGMETLGRIRRSFPNTTIHLVHLPTRADVRSSRYEIDLAASVGTIGVRYFPALQGCRWANDMFHERDGHPNNRGYDNLLECVASYLRSSP
jgi:hypothetical protein